MTTRSMKAAREAIDALADYVGTGAARRPRRRAPRLEEIAAIVTNHFPKGYSAEVVSSWSSTDRKLTGTRLRHPGKGRRGNRLVVKRGPVVLVDHDSSETYRENGEALEKVARLAKHPDAHEFARRWAWWYR